nr:toprim domain-containing protein [Tunicatimonas sp. TK19036]
MAQQTGVGESVSAALTWLSGYEDLRWHPPPVPDPAHRSLVIEQVLPLQHPGLLRYLTETRKLPVALGQRYLEEVHFRQQGAAYFALGFRNEQGGYALRNAYFKGASAHDIRFLAGRGPREGTAPRQAHVFEGVMDYLSLLALRGRERLQGDVVVLNGTSLVDRGVAALKRASYAKVYSWMDPGVGGRRAEERLQAGLSCPVLSMQGLYFQDEDLNGYLVRLRQSDTLRACQQHFQQALARWKR